MGRLLRLELENFKSYNGKQVIGPFDENFVSVIGPNGAGKSNLMDAISFVLGIHAGQLRSANLADLIYRRTSEEDGEAASGTTRGRGRRAATCNGNATFASVAAFYRKDSGEDVIFSRRVSSNGVSEYRINNKPTSYAEYCQAWEGENVLIKARNFLVFQGDVEAIASKSPKDLTGLFEQISGSLELREEYNKAKEQLDKVVEESSLNFNRKRGLGAELKMVQEQKEDVAKFERLMDEKNALNLEYFLWKLFHLESDARKLGGSIEQKESGLAELETAVKKNEAKWKDVKKTQSKYQKDLLVLEKKMKKAQAEVDQEAPHSMELDEKARFAQQKFKSLTENLAKMDHDIEAQEGEVRISAAKLEELNTTANKYEAGAQEQLAAANISPKLLTEYHELKSAAMEMTSKDRLKLESLLHKLAPQQAQKQSMEGKIEEFELVKARLNEEIELLMGKGSDLRTSLENAEGDHVAIRREIAANQARRLKMQQQEAELTERLRGVLSKLTMAKVHKQESEREIKMRATLESLKRIFPGVHGRLIDLCRPSNRKYEQALTVALGRNIDAIVVDHEKTAIACIQYLREQRAGQATFIPLDTIQSGGPKTPSAAAMVDGCRLMIEVIKFDSIYQRAFHYALGSALVCNNLSIAKAVCYGKDVRVKTITLDGTIIHKSGLITGGVTNSGSGHRWEEREVQNLRSERDQLASALQEITKGLKRTESEERLRNEEVELEARIGFLHEELAAQTRRLQGVQEESMHVDQELHQCKQQLLKIQESFSKADKEVAAFNSSINGQEDTVFAAFCKKIKFANIREFESSRLTLSREIDERKLQFATIMNKLQHQIAFLQQQISEAMERRNELSNCIEDVRREIDLVEGQIQMFTEIVENKREALAAVKEELLQVKKKMGVSDNVISEARTSFMSAQNELSEASKEITALECDIDRLLNSRKNILRTCRIEQIELPLLKSSVPFLEVDLEALDQSQTPVLIDYSSLPRQARTSSDMATEHRYKESLLEKQDEMERLAPNLRSLDKIEGAENRLKVTMESFERSKNELKKAKDDFFQIRQRRSDLFNKAYKAISSHIDGIYKDLTRSDLVPTGGTAFLSLENNEEPYLEGVRFHAMPPMKRFLDMDQLSGGEKTVAALALLFAIHSYRPAPFFILDEIDAALDSANVMRVANFIRSRSEGVPLMRSSPHVTSMLSTQNSTQSAPDSPVPVADGAKAVQFLVISLKSSLYEKASSLVGIYRDPEECTSRTLTLRLSDYPE